MNTPKWNEHTTAPDDRQTLTQPQKPMQRDATPIFLQLHSRGNASRTGIVPIDSRVSPSFSQVPPAFPRRIPPFGQARMLQPLAGPGDGVRIHAVMWASVEAAALQADRHNTAKEVLTWYEAV